ncbi:MAG: hypothetical protein ACI9KN_001881 [Gammaproteobacteria bacterium]
MHLNDTLKNYNLLMRTQRDNILNMIRFKQIAVSLRPS